MKIFIAYLILINIFGFAIMKFDKVRAQQHKWRLRERLFFVVAWLFGGPGVWAGMYAFRHKTKHTKFVLGIPVIIVIEVFIVVFIMCRIQASLY